MQPCEVIGDLEREVITECKERKPDGIGFKKCDVERKWRQ
jgi:hypothetical protein